MILIIILQAAALVALILAAKGFMQIPDWRRSGGRLALGLSVLSGLAMCAAIGVCIAVLIQEKVGISLGMSGGQVSDARTWIMQHQTTKPTKGEVGDNIKILSEGLGFLRPRYSQLPPAVQARVDELSRIPDKPTRMLTVTEETRYYDGALEAYTIIESLSK